MKTATLAAMDKYDRPVGVGSLITSEYPSSAASGAARLLFPAPSLPETYAILLTRPSLAQACACSRWIAPDGRLSNNTGILRKRRHHQGPVTPAIEDR